MPGPIWQSVSSPPDSDITDSEIYLIVVVQDGEPRVWNELNARTLAWPLAGDQHGTNSATVPLSSEDSSVMEVSTPLYNPW